ncbi:MAG: IPExxxVDY family protein [Bacteroidetes bacterium]|nr:IPExxxVDY family protein [Bacteroidota bacterium]
MPKKLQLDIDYEKDYTLIGIASHLRDYRLIWAINLKMQLHLVKMDDLKIFQDKKNEFNSFSMFYYEEPNTFKTYYLISNTGEKGLLFPEHRQTNYFLLIKGNITSEINAEIIRNIANIINVLTVHSILLSTIKNVDNFFSDMELFMLELLMKKKEDVRKPYLKKG